MEIDYEPRFLDETVRRHLGPLPEARLYHREREEAYAERDPEERARAFEGLDRRWFARLELDRPLRAAIESEPLVMTAVARVVVGRPVRRQDTGAELLVREPRPGDSPATARTLRLLVTPELFLSEEALGPFLRRELLHVADMLDPRFGYSPRVQASGGPSHERLLRDRYRVVWDATVDGRLVRAGHLPAEGTRARRGEEFARTFPALGAETEAAFASFFDDPAPTHDAIVAFITRPAAGGGAVAGTCALCGFPTTDYDPDPAGLLAMAGGELARDFPHWAPADGCCRQCADIYRTAAMSRAAEAALPGIR